MKIEFYVGLIYICVLQVVCVDYPRPELDNTVNFLEAAYMSATFRNSPRPQKPLEVVIAGAGECNWSPVLILCIRFL